MKLRHIAIALLICAALLAQLPKPGTGGGGGGTTYTFNAPLSESGGAVSYSSGYVTATTASADAHTANSTWEDVASSSVTITPRSNGVVMCEATLMYGYTDASGWAQSEFRLDLDSTSQVVLSQQNDITACSGCARTTSFHHIYTGLSVAAHTIKVQWASFSGGNVSIGQRRLTCMPL